MSDYPDINVPMSDEDKKRVQAVDEAWTGPKLTALVIVFMTCALTFLLALAEGVIGPVVHQ